MEAHIRIFNVSVDMVHTVPLSSHPRFSYNHLVLLAIIKEYKKDILHLKRIHRMHSCQPSQKPPPPQKINFYFISQVPFLECDPATPQQWLKNVLLTLLVEDNANHWLKMALSSTSRVSRLFLSHCCSVAESHSNFQEWDSRYEFFGRPLGQLAAMSGGSFANAHPVSSYPIHDYAATGHPPI